MKAKIYLKQIEKYNDMIQNMVERLDHLRSITMKTTISMQSIERVQQTGDKDCMANAICSVLDFEQELEEETRKLVEKREAIISMMTMLPNKEYRLLYLMYAGKPVERMVNGEAVKQIEYMTLDEAAAYMGRSRRWASNVHGSGLAAIQRMLNERKENENQNRG